MFTVEITSGYEQRLVRPPFFTDRQRGAARENVLLENPRAAVLPIQSLRFRLGSVRAERCNSRSKLIRHHDNPARLGADLPHFLRQGHCLAHLKIRRLRVNVGGNEPVDNESRDRRTVNFDGV